MSESLHRYCLLCDVLVSRLQQRSGIGKWRNWPGKMDYQWYYCQKDSEGRLFLLHYFPPQIQNDRKFDFHRWPQSPQALCIRHPHKRQWSFGSIHDRPQVFVALLLKWVLVCSPQQHFWQGVMHDLWSLDMWHILSCFPVCDQSSILLLLPSTFLPVISFWNMMGLDNVHEEHTENATVMKAHAEMLVMTLNNSYHLLSCTVIEPVYLIPNNQLDIWTGLFIRG